MARTKQDTNSNLDSDLDTIEVFDKDDQHDKVDELDKESVKVDSKTENAIDDPVRVYLMQMGRIPLLSRDEEIEAAVEIDKARFAFRTTMLATDFMLRGAVDALQKVFEKKLRLDRTIEVSVTNKAEKNRIMLRLAPNLKTLKHLLDENKKDYYFAVNSTNKMSERRAAWRRLVKRRNKCVKLVEESNLRFSRLQPLFQQLEEINSRMQALTDLLDEARETGFVGSRSFEEIRAELHYLMQQTYETPATLNRRVVKTNDLHRKQDAAKRILSAGNLRLVVSIAKKYRNRGSQLPGPDPRRKYWANASRRQVRT